MKILIKTKKIKKLNSDEIRHNVNNPLNIISMSAQIMEKRDKRDLTPKIHEAVDRIAKYVREL